MSQLTNAEFLPSPANGRTPNIIRVVAVVPVTLDSELGWYYHDKTRQAALEGSIVNQTWDGYTYDLALQVIDIAVDFKKKRIRMTPPPQEDNFTYLSYLSLQS